MSPRMTHHPDKTRTAGTHRARPARERCAECDGPLTGRGRICAPCLRAPEAAGWPALNIRTVAEAWADYDTAGGDR